MLVVGDIKCIYELNSGIERYKISNYITLGFYELFRRGGAASMTFAGPHQTDANSKYSGFLLLVEEK